jgi:hypothetical protein
MRGITAAHVRDGLSNRSKHRKNFLCLTLEKPMVYPLCGSPNRSEEL